jgi:PAS domain S-box-containing protein
MPAKILVVEDEQIVALDIQRTLAGLGYLVPVTVATGDAAIEQAEALRPDLVLMDIRLRGAMDGIEAAGVIRQRWEIPVIYLTAHADAATLARAKITEPFGYVLKPFDERDLHTTIEMALYKHQMEARLRASERWLNVTLSSIGDGVIATDTAARVVFINPEAERLTGWAAAEAAGRPLVEVFRIINEHTRQPADDPVAKVLATGLIAGLANHTLLIARDGIERPIDDSGAPIQTESGELLGAVLVFRDIAQRRSLEHDLAQRAAELLQADRRKDEFLGMLGHELRNPLAAILGSVEVLSHLGTASAEAAPLLGAIGRQAAHMNRIVDDLLDITRITHGKFTLKKTRIDLVQLVRETAEDHRRSIESKGATLRIDLPAGSLDCEADPTRLSQVLDNLLNNAAKFLGGTGEILVSVQAQPENDRVAIVVRDSGIGMDAQTVQDVFQPFVQAAQCLDRGQGGLGLGLALVRGLVELHGGQVTARSPGLGQGAEFTVELPLHSPPVPTTSAGATPLAADSPRRIVLIDDHPDTLFAMKKMLELAGHEVYTAGDASAGLALARQRLPDVVLCDIGLPGMSGYEFAAALRSEPAVQRAYLVAMSGYGQDEDRRRARDAGFDNHLTKPVHRQHLENLLTSFPRF